MVQGTKEILLTGFLLPVGATAYARGGRWGSHDLATAAVAPGDAITTLSSTNEDEIWGFCHSPHGGYLWSTPAKAVPSASPVMTSRAFGHLPGSEAYL